MYNNLFNDPEKKVTSTAHKGLLSLTLNNKLALDKSLLTPQIIDFLKDQLNFISSEYLTKKRLGKSVYKVEKYFKLIEEQGDRVFIPRGFLNQLKIFFDQNRIAYMLADERPNLEAIQFSSNIKLFLEQSHVVEQAIQNDCGVIVAPSGSGKTLMGLSLVVQRSLPALILVHRKQLLDQWVDRIETFLGIPKTHIGQYSGTKKRQGNQITVAMMQSLARLADIGELRNQFGTIIVDECHHIPAKTFRQVVSELNPRYLYGLTATPKRKHNDEPLSYAHIGDIVAGIKALHAINCLILAFPFSFEGKLIQYIGRLRGHNNHKVIIDYRDSQIPFLERQFKQRQRVYKKLLKKGK